MKFYVFHYSLEEESALSTCTEMLEKKNRELQCGWQTFTAALTKIDTYTSILAAYSQYFIHSVDLI